MNLKARLNRLEQAKQAREESRPPLSEREMAVRLHWMLSEEARRVGLEEIDIEAIAEKGQPPASRVAAILLEARDRAAEGAA